MLDVQHAERRRLAADLHDDPIQVLSVAMMRLDLVAGTIDDTEATVLLEDTHAAVRAAIEQLRRMQFELDPPSLEHDGIAAALRDYADQLVGTTDVDVTIDSDLKREPSVGVASAVFRIARDVIANAHATRFAIRLRDARSGIDVRVVHDGDDRGLDFAAALSRAAGGTWSSSATAEGVTVAFWLPDGSAA
jgi:signal transduction histidine kinase